MKTTKDLLFDLARAYAGEDGKPASDYRLAKLLHVTRSAVSRYQNGHGVFEDQVALRAAGLLGYKSKEAQGLFLTWVHADRALRMEQRNVYEVLAQLASRVSKMAACVVLGAGLTASPAPSEAGFNNNQMGAQDGPNTHMRTKRRRRGASLADSTAAALSALARYARATLPMMAL